MKKKDGITVSFSTNAEEIVEEICSTRDFVMAQDVYRFSISLAIAKNLKPEALKGDGRGETYSMGSLDKDSEIRTLVKTFCTSYSDDIKMTKFISELAEAGLNLINKKYLKSGKISFSKVHEDLK